MSGAAMVLTVVDTRTGTSHLVADDAAALHRRSGRYPTLCGTHVAAASLTTTPARDCDDCRAVAQDNAQPPAGQASIASHREFLPWTRARRAGAGPRRRTRRRPVGGHQSTPHDPRRPGKGHAHD